MKFGRYLKAQKFEEWGEYYINYSKLKSIIKALAEVETKALDLAPSSGYGERVTSLSMVPNPSVRGKFEGKDISEADFFTALEAEMKKIDDFTHEKMMETRAKVQELMAKVTSRDVKNIPSDEREQLNSRAKELGDEFLRLEKFVNLNFLGFHKILKKHDKQLPVPCQRFYMTRLHGQKWVKHDYSKLFVELSKIHALLRGDISGKNEDAAGQGFIRSTTKYWVRTEDISKVKHIVLQHLPVFQHQLDALEGDSQLTNSVYFDNAQMELYHGRLDKSPDAIAIRLRWYATADPELVFVERKTHKDSWTGEISVKERFTLKENQVLPFLRGEFTVEDKIEEMRKLGKSEKDQAYVRRLFTEIYNQIDSKQLRPTLRTQYMRVAYQIPFDPTVRISLDTNLTLIAENPKVGPDCATEGRWYRNPDIVLPPTEYTHFPHAVLEVKLSLKEGQEAPKWVQDLIASDMLTEVHKFSKFLHGCAVLLSHDVQAVPYWVDDESIRPSMLRSQPVEKKRSMINMDAHGKGDTSQFEFGEVPTINLMKRKLSMQQPGSNGYGSIQNGAQQWNDGPIYSNTSDDSTFFRWILSCCGLLSSSSHVKIKPRKVPMKIEPKVFFANERTLLSWLHMAVTLGSISAALLGFAGSRAGSGENVELTRGERGAKLVGMLLLPVGIVFCVYALMTFYWRGKKIRARVDGPFHDPIGPGLLALILMLALLAIFVLFLLEGVAIKV